jgi:ribosomal RNA-processing protein 8
MKHKGHNAGHGQKQKHKHQPQKAAAYAVQKPKPPAAPAAPTQGKQGGLSALQQQFAKKLEGSRFRIINEQLYTSRGEESFASFQSNPGLFDVYHQGFREQASHWPHNPLDSIIAWICAKHPRAVVADMGCGDARLSVSLTPQNKVHSFDLVAPNPNPRGIVACDIAHVPLKDSSVDIVVFCLALMGTNIADFLLEARRILKPNGVLKVAEVRSRFESKDSSDGVKKFIRLLKRSGFDFDEPGLGSVNRHNEMFFEIEGRRSNRAPQAETGGDTSSSGTTTTSFSAKPCVYKRR